MGTVGCGGSMRAARANGDAFAGLARVLEVLPAGDPMPHGVPARLSKDGVCHSRDAAARRLWNGNLLELWDAPGPESAGTYAFDVRLAWCAACSAPANRRRPRPGVWDALARSSSRGTPKRWPLLGCSAPPTRPHRVSGASCGRAAGSRCSPRHAIALDVFVLVSIFGQRPCRAFTHSSKGDDRLRRR